MKKWQFFFDGACHLCFREIEHYRKIEGSDTIEFIDISMAEFKAEQFGLDRAKVNREMHVKSPDGRLHVGVDAFIEIWKQLPRYQTWARLAQKNG